MSISSKILARRACGRHAQQRPDLSGPAGRQPVRNHPGTGRQVDFPSLDHARLLAEGTTEVEGVLEGEDALATIQAFRDMGVVIEGPQNGRVTVHGVGLHGLKAPPGADLPG
ncbi:hypothetical protein ACPA9J_22475 [Pseudomonas aeruginosa]